MKVFTTWCEINISQSTHECVEGEVNASDCTRRSEGMSDQDVRIDFGKHVS